MYKDIEKFEDMKVLVLGDVMVDAYLYGSVQRISPEAPVPILNVEQREYRLGGAANVALNLQSLKAIPLLFSVIGEDKNAVVMSSLLKESKLRQEGIVHSSSRITTIKTRVIANKTHQILRIDEEITNPLSQDNENEIIAAVSQRLTKGDVKAVIFVDYDKGVLTARVIREVIRVAKECGVITTVDPKLKNFDHYHGVTLFKPNRKELYEGLKCPLKKFALPDLNDKMKDFADWHDIALMMTTLSEYGVAMYQKEHNQFYHTPAHIRNISDVSGAGDTVISVATLALCVGMEVEKMMKIANLAGGIVCEYAGVVPITAQMLQKEWEKTEIENK